MSENFRILIEKLKAKTIKKEALWTMTSRDNEFKLDLGKGAITIDNWPHDQSGIPLVDLAIFNDVGDKIDYIVYDESEKEHYEMLLDLHSLAKGSYYKVDETFQNIFKELDSNKTIGIERKRQDDLPF